MKIERIVIDAIDASSRLRPLNEAAIVALAESMKRLGQLQPISVHSPSDSEIYIVAGAHRVEAARRLGWEDIAGVFVTGDAIERELQEIAENLHRAELTALERSTQIARWIELTTAKSSAEAEKEKEVSRQPDAKPKGGRPKGGVRDAARKIGVGDAEARRAVKVASIAPEAKQAARDAGLDDNRSALLAVAQEKTVEAQVGKVGEIARAKAVRAKTTHCKQAAEQSKATALPETEHPTTVDQNLDDRIDSVLVHLALMDLLSAVGAVEPKTVAAGVLPTEVADMQSGLATIEEWLGRFAVALDRRDGSAA